MDSYVGQIILFPSLRPLADWHICDGSTLQMSAYPALFAIIGTTYGGDGRTTFALPDLRGRIPIGQGQGQSTPPPANHTLGQTGGQENVTLTVSQMGNHSHAFNASSAQATTNNPSNAVLGSVPEHYVAFFDPPNPLNGLVPFAMSNNAIAAARSSYTAHNNMMPSVALNYYICINGLFPQRP